MLDTASLSLEQAPPISIPLRFFFTAPMFGMVAGMLVMVAGADMAVSRWTPAVLAFTHLLTLGFLSLVMVGAVIQMLPVLAGSPLPRAVPVGTLVHVTLTGGILLMVPGFLSPDPRFMILALSLLGTGCVLFLAAAGVALIRVRNASPTVKAMCLAVISLAVTLALGTLLGLGRVGLASLGVSSALTDVHLTWGALGWMGLLLIGVAYQVVPMFQVTPEYPEWLRRFLAATLFAGLLLWSSIFIGLSGTEFSSVPADLVLSLLLLEVAGFAIATLVLQSRRQRKIYDPTLAFWRVGLISLVASALLGAVAQWTPSVGQSSWYPLVLGWLVLVGAGVSLTNGMLYKIVPFLCWFHLQNRQIALQSFGATVPHMKGFVPDRLAKRQYRLHVGVCFFGLIGLFWPAPFLRVFGLFLFISNATFLVIISMAARRFRRTFADIEANREDQELN